MTEILKAVQAARIEERERLLGPNALSVSSSLFKHLAPKGYDILHIAGRGKARITERGMVVLNPPVLAVLQEETMNGNIRAKKVLELEISAEYIERGFNGDGFSPLITERDSALFSVFCSYMNAVKADPNWHERPLPRGGYTLPKMTSSEEAAWEKWIQDELRRATEVPHHLKSQR